MSRTIVLVADYPTDAPVTGGDSLTEDLNVYYEVCAMLRNRPDPRCCTMLMTPSR